MSQFITEARNLIYQHGVEISFITVTEGGYDVETGSSTNTEKSVTVKAFPKKLKISQYNYPNLIGKQAVEFLVVCLDLTTAPATQDKITYDGADYSVDSYSEHIADGSKVIYKIIAVKG